MSKLKKGRMFNLKKNKKIAKILALTIFIFLFFIIVAGQYALAEDGYLKKKIAQANQLNSGQLNSGLNNNLSAGGASAVITNDNSAATAEKSRLEAAAQAEEAVKLRQQEEFKFKAEQARSAEEAKLAEENRKKQELEEAKRRAEAETFLAEAAKQKAAENARLAEIAKQQADENARLAEENNKKQLEQARLAEENSKKITEQARLAEAARQKAIEDARLAEITSQQATTVESRRLAEEKLNLIRQAKQIAEEQAAQSQKQVVEAKERIAQSKKESTQAQEDLDRANKDFKKADIGVKQAEILVKKVNNVSENNLQELQNISKLTGVELVNEPIGATTAEEESRLNIKQLAGKSLVMKNMPLSPAETQKSGVIMTNIEKGLILEPTAQEINIFNNNNPLAKTNKLVGLTVLASAETENKNQAEISPVIMMLDSDGDGLSDDLEKRIGTDPYNTDTDGDGYSDYIEVKNNYDPLGKGKKNTDMKPAEKAIVNREMIERPKFSTAAVSGNLMVKKIMTGQGEIIAGAGTIGTALNSSTKNSAADQDGKLKFEGVAAPNDVVLLFIYSEMPIVVTMDTDKNGNWVYDLDKTLISGDHEAYVVVMDEKGKIKSKSSPLAFFVKEAKAVTLAEGNSADSNLVATPNNSQSDNMIIWYMVCSGVLISLLFAVYLFFSRDSKK